MDQVSPRSFTRGFLSPEPYLERRMDSFLLGWKTRERRLPLVVAGPRQVGKTETILRFGLSSYESVVDLDFVRDKDMLGILERGYSPAEIIKAISLREPRYRFIPGKTLIFFDECQELPDVATSLKYFARDGRFDLILSGSLLGVFEGQIRSHAAGYKEEVDATSMDFWEYLLASGYPHDLWERLIRQAIEFEPFAPGELERLFALWDEHVLVGGMPLAVSSFIREGTYGTPFRLQREYVRSFEEDIGKYSQGLDKARLLSAFRSLAPTLGKENKRFRYANIAHGARKRDYLGAIDWLEKSGILAPAIFANALKEPVPAYLDPSAFKPYFFDTGFLMAQLDEGSFLDLTQGKDFGIWKGALLENAVASALWKEGAPVWTYRREDSTLEIDFLLASRAGIVLVEAKAGDGRAKSMTAILAEGNPDIAFGIKLARKNIGRAGKVLTLPSFYAPFLPALLRDDRFLSLMAAS